MTHDSRLAFPRFERAESNPKISVFPSGAPAESTAYVRPLGATPVTDSRPLTSGREIAPDLLEGDTLDGHLRNAQQLLGFALELPDVATPELLRDVARRLELVARMLTRDVQVVE